MSLTPTATALAQRLAQVRVGGEVFERLRERFRIIGPDLNAALADAPAMRSPKFRLLYASEQVNYAADGCGDDGARVRHRLDERERRALVSRSERDHVERRVEVFRVVAQAGEFYIIAEAERRRVNLKLLAQMPVADDDERDTPLAQRASDAHMRRIIRAPQVPDG